MDFKNYAGNKGKNNAGGFSPEDLPKDDAENIQQVVNKYADKSDDVMMNDLVKMVTEERRAGRLSDRDLDKFAETAGMMMNPEQKSKLYGLIKQLKNK